jgi:hypothetical protein
MQSLGRTVEFDAWGAFTLVEVLRAAKRTAVVVVKVMKLVSYSILL